MNPHSAAPGRVPCTSACCARRACRGSLAAEQESHLSSNQSRPQLPRSQHPPAQPLASAPTSARPTPHRHLQAMSCARQTRWCGPPAPQKWLPPSRSMPPLRQRVGCSSRSACRASECGAGGSGGGGRLVTQREPLPRPLQWPHTCSSGACATAGHSKRNMHSLPPSTCKPRHALPPPPPHPPPQPVPLDGCVSLPRAGLSYERDCLAWRLLPGHPE